jgi:hypothetical protein
MLDYLLALSFGLGIIGLALRGYQWLMSPPTPKNNRFMAREFHDED